MSGAPPLLALVLLAALALPGAAAGQSAGDEQYKDPFSGTHQKQNGDGPGDSKGGGSGGPAGGGGRSAGGSSDDSDSAGVQAPTAGGSVDSASSPQGRATLAYTGFSATMAALAGAALLAMGLGLRLAVWTPPDNAHGGMISLIPFELSSAPPAALSARSRRGARVSARRRVWRT